jgi:hypothetical protein
LDRRHQQNLRTEGDSSMTALTLRERITRRSIPFQTLAVLASVGGSTVYATEVSKWASGKEPIPAAKAARLMDMLIQVERMLDGVAIRPDLRDASVVRAALEVFENKKIKQEEIVPAPLNEDSERVTISQRSPGKATAARILSQQ